MEESRARAQTTLERFILSGRPGRSSQSITQFRLSPAWSAFLGRRLSGARSSFRARTQASKHSPTPTQSRESVLRRSSLLVDLCRCSPKRLSPSHPRLSRLCCYSQRTLQLSWCQITEHLIQKLSTQRLVLSWVRHCPSQWLRSTPGLSQYFRRRISH